MTARQGEAESRAEAIEQENECPYPDCYKPIAETSFCCLVHWKALGYVGRTRIKSNRLGHDQALRIAGQHWFPDE